jgi:hypothetical protein
MGATCIKAIRFRVDDRTDLFDGDPADICPATSLVVVSLIQHHLHRYSFGDDPEEAFPCGKPFRLSPAQYADQIGDAHGDTFYVLH